MQDDAPLTNARFLDYMLEFKAAIEHGFTSLEARMNQRFEQVDRRFEQIDRRFEQIDRQFRRLSDRVDGRFDGVERRIDRLERSEGL